MGCGVSHEHGDEGGMGALTTAWQEASQQGPLPSPKEKSIKILVCGLSGSGKTSLIHAVKMYLTPSAHQNNANKDNNLNAMIPLCAPTRQVDSNEIKLQLQPCQFIDTPGVVGKRDRIYEVLHKVTRILYIIDSTDSTMLYLAGQELHQLVNQPNTRKAALLIICSKQDIPGALSPYEISSELRLSSLQHPLFVVLSSSASNLPLKSQGQLQPSNQQQQNQLGQQSQHHLDTLISQIINPQRQSSLHHSATTPSSTPASSPHQSRTRSRSSYFHQKQPKR